LIVLGDANAGKSALLARLRGEQIPPLKNGIGLTYSYMNIYEDDVDEPAGTLDIWVLEVCA
jgi:GTPase SAR1 family protein